MRTVYVVFVNASDLGKETIKFIELLLLSILCSVPTIVFR